MKYLILFPKLDYDRMARVVHELVRVVSDLSDKVEKN